jgi:hypothetical protein
VLPTLNEPTLNKREPYLAQTLDPGQRADILKDIAGAEKRGEGEQARRARHMLDHPEYYELRREIGRCWRRLDKRLKKLEATVAENAKTVPEQFLSRMGRQDTGRPTVWREVSLFAFVAGVVAMLGDFRLGLVLLLTAIYLR